MEDNFPTKTDQNIKDFYVNNIIKNKNSTMFDIINNVINIYDDYKKEENMAINYTYISILCSLFGHQIKQECIMKNFEVINEDYIIATYLFDNNQKITILDIEKAKSIYNYVIDTVMLLGNEQNGEKNVYHIKIKIIKNKLLEFLSPDGVKNEIKNKFEEKFDDLFNKIEKNNKEIDEYILNTKINTEKENLEKNELIKKEFENYLEYNKILSQKKILEMNNKNLDNTLKNKYILCRKNVFWILEKINKIIKNRDDNFINKYRSLINLNNFFIKESEINDVDKENLFNLFCFMYYDLKNMI